ncbi:FUSC family protein [Sphingomonas morindae]|uniref:FUSC family protein n=1 Tax=Sphingomonas morindae TaxID=1541170 RepID=A0ABY4X4G5_9SPHN|nr:FUSC family protein [Sphingomonas morindae]USI71796.1 FUSC family protein [Sphingomonas morindae]
MPSRSGTARARSRRLARLSATAAKRMPTIDRLADGLVHAGLAVTAALLAYLPTRAIGLREGFWAAITALVVAQTDLAAVRSTARDQALGAALGGLVGLAFAQWPLPLVPRYAGAVAIAVLAAWSANIASAARLSGVTATIILLVPHQNSAGQMMVARITEVCWGIASAFAVAAPAGWLRARLSEEA